MERYFRTKCFKTKTEAMKRLHLNKEYYSDKKLTNDTLINATVKREKNGWYVSLVVKTE